MAIQHANRGIVKKDLQLYYNREFLKSFRGEATTNTCNLNSRYNYAWANAVVTRDTTAPAPPPITGFEIAKLRSTDGADAQTILYTAAVDQVNGGVYTHSAYIYLESGTWVSVGQHWNPWDYGIQTFIPLNKWTRVSYTVTNTPNNYGDVACSYNTNGTVYITATQYEKKSYSTPFVNGSRTANTIAGGGGLLDISGNNANTDLSLMSFDSTGYVFNGSSNYISVTKTLYVPMTISGYAKYTDQSKALNTFMNGQPHPTLAISLNRNGAGNLQVYIGNGSGWLGTPSINSSSTIAVNTWYNITFTCDGTTSTLYLNGINVGTSANIPSGFGSYFYIGHLTDNASASEYFKGSISSFQIFGRSLTSDEVLQNFNATRKTYGL